MADQERLARALHELDPSNDEHWTAEDLPRMEALWELAGDAKLTRGDVTSLAPEFSREIAQQHRDRQAALEEQRKQNEDRQISQEAGRQITGEETPDDVLTLPPEVVYADHGLTVKALEGMRERYATAAKEKVDAEKRMTDIQRHIERLERFKVRHERRDPRLAGGPSSIREYLDSQQRHRQKQADSAKAFIEAGTTVKDVRRALQTTSPLDASLSARPNPQAARRTPPLSPGARAAQGG